MCVHLKGESKTTEELYVQDVTKILKLFTALTSSPKWRSGVGALCSLFLSQAPCKMHTEGQPSPCECCVVLDIQLYPTMVSAWTSKV